MTIELQGEVEERLLESAREQGRRPEELAAYLVRLGLAARESRLPPDATEDERGWIRDAEGNLLGFDGMSWREIAHLGHRR